MATTYTSLYHTRLRQQETDIDAFYARLLSLLLIALNRFARAGQLDTVEARRALERVVRTLFASPDGRAWRADARGMVVPQSDYFTVLWRGVQTASALAVARHTALMRGMTAAPGSEEATLAYLDGYAPPTQRRLQDGKLLAERVARVTDDTAARVGNLVDRSEAKTRAALTQMFTDGHFDGKRLALTEMLLAYTWIGLASARLNPRVEMFDVYLAANHPCCDVCDTYAAASPYPVSAVHALPPYHANCLCGVRWRRGRRQIPANLITPLAGSVLVRLLLKEN